jgi:hypothetical protein
MLYSKRIQLSFQAMSLFGLDAQLELAWPARAHVYINAGETAVVQHQNRHVVIN